MNLGKNRKTSGFLSRNPSRASAFGPAILVLAALLFVASGAWAKPTTTEQATNVISKWLGLEARPMGSLLGGQIRNIQTFNDDTGNPAYYVVFLEPSGLVFLPADDLVEPIIGFVSGATSYDPSPANPLWALVSRDIPSRVAAARDLERDAARKGETLAPASSTAAAQGKWAWLESRDLKDSAPGIPGISDVRVAPFVQSKWSQSTVNGQACYNYYTPPHASGSSDNYVCGCTATAMAQVMRYWRHPSSPVVSTFTIAVDEVEQSATIRGGDGSGGAYDWNNMVLDPETSGVNLAQRQAIGALTYDAGISVEMYYSAAWSGAWGYGYAFVDTFRYSNGIMSYPGQVIPTANRNAMINPNLHAQYPVIVAINGPDGGHSVVCDGYGYNAASMYHHLNMGWAGYEDAWYNLPDVVAGGYTFNTVYGLTYNIFVTGTGEIIAGRVTGSLGNPIGGATVSAHRSGGGTFTTTTDSKGIYALAKVPSASSFTVSVAKPGYSFTSQSVSTLTSTDYTIVAGNVWGVDFNGTISDSKSIVEILDLLFQ